VVNYQPIVALADARVVGYEALVRWAHPTGGLLVPQDFLDVAEDTGLITAIGAQVLDQVFALLAERPDLPGPVSVNVSAVQLSAPGWCGSVTNTLAAHMVDPTRLVIELARIGFLPVGYVCRPWAAYVLGIAGGGVRSPTSSAYVPGHSRPGRVALCRKPSGSTGTLIRCINTL